MCADTRGIYNSPLVCVYRKMLLQVCNHLRPEKGTVRYITVIWEIFVFKIVVRVFYINILLAGLFLISSQNIIFNSSIGGHRCGSGNYKLECPMHGWSL